MTQSLGGGDEPWFDKLTMKAYELQACPEPAEGPTRIALDIGMEKKAPHFEALFVFVHLNPNYFYSPPSFSAEIRMP